jgi:hypothetical protein
MVGFQYIELRARTHARTSPQAPGEALFVNTSTPNQDPGFAGGIELRYS